MKKRVSPFFVPFLVVISLLIFITGFTLIHPTGPVDSVYGKKYLQSIGELEKGLKSIRSAIFDPGSDKKSLKEALHSCRTKLKAADIWLRYLDQNTYKLLNGPLPVEWETEVFEKTEKPYRRPGAGLSLAEQFLDDKNYSKDSLDKLISSAIHALPVYLADTTLKPLETADHFFFANRLFLLNLSTIYNTGFECPDTSAIIPELKEMMRDVKLIYADFNESFPDKKIDNEYLIAYDASLTFVSAQSDHFSAFNHFLFIRDYLNPLYALNQKMINRYNAQWTSVNDFTLSSECYSIFDKGLYRGQNYKGVYISVTDEKALAELAEIGKQLFYDPILSGNNKRSCVSCHKPEQLFTDTALATSKQFEEGKFLPRNTPTLVNVVFQHLLMLDGRLTTLQKQAKAVTTNPIEMGGDEKDILEKVLSCPAYKKVFTKYLKLTPLYSEVSIDHILSAITLFYGQFSFYYSPFDDAMNKKAAFGPELVHGFNLFMSKAQCATCHYLPQFNGVKPPYIGSEFEVIGVPGDSSFKSLSSDMGRFAIYPSEEMKHAFRTNTVRNSQYTKPYMYNGVFKTLDQVIDFYNTGGGRGKGMQVENQTLSSDSLKLTSDEKKSLIAFIQSLNEKIPPVTPPSELPRSSHKTLNERKVGGAY